MSYKAKSAAAAMAALAVAFGLYFLWARQPGRSAADVMAHMVGAIIVLAVIATMLEVIIAVANRREAAAGGKPDERDSLIGLRSARNGYFALLAMIWAIPLIALSGVSGVVTANCTLAMIVLAEMVNFGSKIFYDRRGF